MGAQHFNRKPTHVVLVLRGSETYHTYQASSVWTLDQAESLSEEPPF